MSSLFIWFFKSLFFLCAFVLLRYPPELGAVSTVCTCLCTYYAVLVWCETYRWSLWINALTVLFWASQGRYYNACGGQDAIGQRRKSCLLKGWGVGELRNHLQSRFEYTPFLKEMRTGPIVDENIKKHIKPDSYRPDKLWLSPWMLSKIYRNPMSPEEKSRSGRYHMEVEFYLHGYYDRPLH